MQSTYKPAFDQPVELSLPERRRGLRIRRDHPVKIFAPSANRYIPGHTQDISATGLRLELPASAPVVPGKEISVHVGLDPAGSSFAHRRRMLPARIVWIDRRSEGSSSRLTAGIEFVSTIAVHLDAA